jgi:hypothetical protein
MDTVLSSREHGSDLLLPQLATTSHPLLGWCCILAQCCTHQQIPARAAFAINATHSRFGNTCTPFASLCCLQALFNDKMVLPGDVLSINDIANEPKIEITQFNPTGVYSLLMLDPDMPSPHKPEYKWV